jgi:hypothetical protein
MVEVLGQKLEKNDFELIGPHLIRMTYHWPNLDMVEWWGMSLG